MRTSDLNNRIHVGWLTERWTGMIAFVREVMASSIRVGSIVYVSASTSTNTGFAPQ